MKAIFFSLLLLSAQAIKAQDQMFAVCPAKVGAEMPKVTVQDSNNTAIPLASLVGTKPTVLIFYRGAWCGFCTEHLAALNNIKKDIDALGFQVFGITVDQASKLKESITCTTDEIQVYSDSNIEAIKAFGLDWKLDNELYDKYKVKYNLDLEEWSGQNHHSLPVPAIFVIKDGLIQFQYVNPNYKVRLKPETLLAVLSTM
jgi:peroxiredoxin